MPGIKYADNEVYEYFFRIYLNSSINSTPVFPNSILNKRESRIFEKSFIGSEYLLNGNNTLSINYSANLQECNAYLDWVEFFYPQEFRAVNNYLSFNITVIH